MNRNPNDRLGSGPRDVEEIMEHPFFDSIDWEAIYQKKIPPPYLPSSSRNKTPDTELRMSLADEVYSQISASGDKGYDDFPNFSYESKSVKLK